MVLLFIISFFLDGIIMNVVGVNSIFLPLFTLTSIVINYSLYYKKIDQLRIIACILGIIYDICYGGMLFYHAIFFLFTVELVKYIYSYLSINYLNTIIIGIFMVFVYRIITYFYLIFFQIINFEPIYILISFLQSIVLNLIYLIIFSWIAKIINQKRRIKIIGRN